VIYRRRPPGTRSGRAFILCSVVSGLLLTTHIPLIHPIPAFSQDRPDGPEARYRIHLRPAETLRQVGTPPCTDAADHGRVQLSPAEVARNQARVAEYLKTQSGPLTKSDVVKIYELAGDFTVIHGMLGNTISPELSRQIGRHRQAIHEEALSNWAREAKRRGITKKLGVNDFGSGADPDKVNAKTDIDFTQYADGDGVTGSDLIKGYKRHFGEVTAKYGARLSPEQLDIVAHQFEATIPDWRQARALGDFEIRLRRGTQLLRQNPEAYFLEGAFLQQVMRRSVAPGAKTFTWYEVGPDGKIVRTNHNAAEIRQFFYTPEPAARYAFGAAVGNWHFCNSHSDVQDKAKYLLRSMDDGIGLTLPRGSKRCDYADLPNDQRAAVVDELYGHVPKAVRDQIKLTLDTASRIRRMKAEGTFNPEAFDSMSDAFKPLVEHERTLKYRDSLPDPEPEILVKLAQKRFHHVTRRILVENMIRSSTARLKDWSMPNVKPVLVKRDGRVIRIDPDKQERLQYAAYVELENALSLMDDVTIEQIKRHNPKFRSDIEIMERIIKKKRDMFLVTEEVDFDQALKQRMEAARQIEDAFAELELLSPFRKAWRRIADSRFGRTWVRGMEYEAWLQRGMVDALVAKAGLPGVAYGFQHFRECAGATNDRLLHPDWTLRIGIANSLVTVLTEAARQGEFWNERVAGVLLWEGLRYVPVLGLGMDIYTGGMGTVRDMALLQFVPGYAPIFLYIQTMRGLATLTGTVIFTPIKNDRVLLAYQGYLDPEEGGRIYAGNPRRINAPRPALLHFVDPDRNLPLEERRKRFYKFFAPRVTEAARKALEDIPYFDENENFGRIYGEKLGEKLVEKTKAFVNDWWDAKGEWSDFDELSVKRMLEYGPNEIEFKYRLVDQLIQDYIAGQSLAAKEISAEKERAQGEFQDAVHAIAARELAFEQDLRSLGPDINEAGELAYAVALDEMTEIEPSIRIIAAPRVIEEKAGEDGEGVSGGKVLGINNVSLRAIVDASLKRHPGPWRIQWEIRASDGQVRTLEQEEESFRTDPAAKAGDVTVIAKAFDGNDRLIIKGEIPIQIEMEEERGEEFEEEPGITYEGIRSNEILDALNRAAEEAEQRSRVAADLCRSAAGQAGEALRQAEALSPGILALQTKMADLEARALSIKQLTESAKTFHEAAEKSASAVGSRAHRLEALSLEICEKTQAMTRLGCGDELRRQRQFSELDSRKAGIAQLLKEANIEMGNAERAAGEVRRIYGEIRSIKAELQAMEGLRGALNQIQEAAGVLNQAQRAALGARGEVDAIERVRAGAEAAAVEGEGLLAATQGQTESRTLLEQFRGLLDRVRQAHQRVKDCPEDSRKRVTAAGDRISALENSLKDLEERYLKLQDALDTGDGDAAAGALDRAEMADYVVTLARAYAERAAKNATDAAFCVTLAQDLMKKPLTGVVPDVTGLSVNEATGILNKEGFAADPHTVSPAPRLDLEHLVRSQSPRAGAKAQCRNPVRLECYGGFDIRSTLASTDCSRWPGSVAVWNALAGRAECGCPEGMIWNGDRTACIDARQARIDEYCNRLGSQLTAAAQAGDVDRFGSLLSQASMCDFYERALADYQGMLARRRQKPEPRPDSKPDPNARHLERIVVTQQDVTIDVWDSECEDGDKITLLINGRAVLSNHTLTKKKKSVRVRVPSGRNMLEIIAVDSGTDCPPKANKAETRNTAAIAISHAVEGGRQSWNLRMGDRTQCEFIVR
jgi:hypothetical protein